jgi:hypothetical protein
MSIGNRKISEELENRGNFGGRPMSKLRFVDFPSIIVMAVAAGIPLLIVLL